MKDSGFKKIITAIATLTLLICPLMGPVSAKAQTANTGVITGVVRDSKGGVVADATIKAINPATGVERKTVSSDSGSYELSALPPATYRVEVEAKGFAKFTQENLVVNVLARVTLDPERSFGQPICTPESVPTVVLAKAFRAEGSLDSVARWFMVHPKSVSDAVDFEARISTAA